jgi:hypothetical protein
MPPVRSEDELNEPFDPDKLPPEPPEILENQRYISKLIQWGLEASKRERSRPHLVGMPVSPETLTAQRQARAASLLLPLGIPFWLLISGL